MMLEGQLVGGAVQGLGGALFEEFTYGENGEPLAVTFADYLMPTLRDVPAIETLITEDAPSPRNPLGLKGGGEAGINAVGAVIASAIDDAIGIPGAVTELPVTPQRLRAILRRREGDRARACVGRNARAAARVIDTLSSIRCERDAAFEAVWTVAFNRDLLPRRCKSGRPRGTGMPPAPWTGASHDHQPECPRCSRDCASCRRRSFLVVASFPAQSADDIKPPPPDYRQWFHVNTMIVDKDSPLFKDLGGMHNVYVNAVGIAGAQEGRPLSRPIDVRHRPA